MIEITWVKSAIGYNQDQKDTIRALGLKRLGQTVRKLDTAAIRGMVRAVNHLLQVRFVKDGQ